MASMNEITKPIDSLTLIKSEIIRTMGNLELKNFDELDPLLSRLSKEEFSLFIEERVANLTDQAKLSAKRFLGARKSYLDMVKENGRKT